MIRNQDIWQKFSISFFFSAPIQLRDILYELNKLDNYSCRLLTRILRVLQQCVSYSELGEAIEPYLYANRTIWQRRRRVTITSDAMNYMIKFMDKFFTAEMPDKNTCTFNPTIWWWTKSTSFGQPTGAI